MKSRSPYRGGPPVTSAEPDGNLSEVAALVERARTGDSQAFADLYDRYVGAVYRYLLYRVGDRATAEDLTSECFLRALRRIGDFQWTGRDVGAWFITIARNLVTDYFKSSRMRLEISAENLPEVPARQAQAGVCDPSEVLAQRAEAAVLYGALRLLKPDQREVVFLRFIQGFSVGEVARVLRKSEGAIKALQYRAMRSLARLLSEEERCVTRDHRPAPSLERRDR
ncbi:MAG: sigma-70 family RNA polymerase sigma factor [Actinomycetota bacterium]